MNSLDTLVLHLDVGDGKPPFNLKSNLRHTESRALENVNDLKRPPRPQCSLVSLIVRLLTARRSG